MRARSGQLNSYVIVPTFEIDSEGDAIFESRFSITKQDAIFILEYGWESWIQTTPMCVVSYRTALLHVFDYAQTPEAVDRIGDLADDSIQDRISTIAQQSMSEMVKLANDLASDNPLIYSESNIVEWAGDTEYSFYDLGFNFLDTGVVTNSHSHHQCRELHWPVGLPTDHWKMIVDSRGLPSVEVLFVPLVNPVPELHSIAEARLNLYLVQTPTLTPFLPLQHWRATGLLGTYMFTPEGKMERAWGNLEGETPVSDSGS